MKLQRVITILQGVAEERLAEPWDHVGLQVGDPAWPVRRAMLCIDLTDAVLAEATAGRIDLIVAYHPPIFQPLAALTSGPWKQRIILQAARCRIAIYSPHTALDAAQGGVNDWLVRGLGKGRVRPIKPAAAPDSPIFKLVTFVPREQADDLRQAMAAAGAGHIGDYQQCSFSNPGQGTFLGGPGTQPAVGQPGRLERVPESRLEMVCPGGRVEEVISALRLNHPYEEPAFDLYRLETPTQPDVGQGRIIALEAAVALHSLIKRLKAHLGVQHLEAASPPGLKRVRTVGVCAGAGGALLTDAGPLDVFITGEMRHHDILEAVQRGVTVILAGHTQTERPYLRVYRRRLQQASGGAIQWFISRADQPPTKHC